MHPHSKPWNYRIVVEGELDPDWSSWLHGLELVSDNSRPATTTLTGPVRDQAALRSILTRLWNMNLTLVSVNRTDNRSDGGNHDR